jgi:hypothetical protein
MPSRAMAWKMWSEHRLHLSQFKQWSNESDADGEHKTAIALSSRRNFSFPAVESPANAVCVIDHIRRLEHNFQIFGLPYDLIRQDEYMIVPSNVRNASRFLVANHAYKQALEFGQVSADGKKAKAMVKQISEQFIPD